MKRLDANKLLSDIVSENRKTYLKAADAISSFDSATRVDQSVFLRGLDSDNEDIVFWSILALQHLGPNASESIEKLIELTKSENLLFRISAVQALSQIGPEDSRSINGIFEAFQDSDANVRREALQACINLPDLNEDRLAEISGMATDPDDDVVRWTEIVQRNRRINESREA